MMANIMTNKKDCEDEFGIKHCQYESKDQHVIRKMKFRLKHKDFED